MKFYAKLNPLLAYLIKYKYIDFIPELMPVFWLWVVSSLMIAGLILGNVGSVIICILPLCALIYIPCMFVPIAISYSAAASTSNSVASQDYELLKLANISDRTILWSYIVATLYRFRGLLVVVVGFAPIIFMSAGFTWVIWETGFGENSCIETPIGNRYCESTDPPVRSQTERIGTAVQLIFLTLGLVIGVAGINVFFSVVGAVLGFWQKNRFVALISAGVLAFIVGLVAGIVIIPEIMFRAFYKQGFDLLTLLVLLFILTPYLLSYGLVRATSHLVRRSA